MLNWGGGGFNQLCTLANSARMQPCTSTTQGLSSITGDICSKRALIRHSLSLSTSAIATVLKNRNAHSLGFTLNCRLTGTVG